MGMPVLVPVPRSTIFKGWKDIKQTPVRSSGVPGILL
jgi:hypothetical protein